MAKTAYNVAVANDTPYWWVALNDTSGTTPFDNGQGASTLPAGESTSSYAAAFTLSGAFTLNQSGPASDVKAITFAGGKAAAASGGVTVGATCTIECWVFPTAVPATNYGTILEEVSSGNGLYLGHALANPQRIDFYVGGDKFSSINAWTLNAWNHIVVSINAGSGTIYVNGVSVGTFTGWTGATFNTVGSDTAPDPLTGSMCNLAVYKTALSGARVLVHYNAMLAAAAAAPVAFSPSSLICLGVIQVSHSGGVTLVGDGTALQASFGTVISDDLGVWNSAAPNQIVVPAGCDHIRITYNVAVSNQTNVSAVAGQFGADAWQNGFSLPLMLKQYVAYPTGTLNGAAHAINLNATSLLIPAVPGDRISLMVWQTTGQDCTLVGNHGLGVEFWAKQASAQGAFSGGSGLMSSRSSVVLGAGVLQGAQ